MITNDTLEEARDQGVVSSSPKRPGISNQFLQNAGIHHVTATQAKSLCGLNKPGLWIPYFDLNGQPIQDKYGDYGRLRLDQPEGGHKYHQRTGTGVHAHLPPGLRDTPQRADLIVVEGEFKAASLVEAGFPAVGASGFYGFANNDGDLVEELADAICLLKPNRILFLGDDDTTFNWQFSDAAIKFARLVDIPILLPRIPLNSLGKGVDDIKESMGAEFPDWWRGQINKAEPISDKSTPQDLALKLITREKESIKAVKVSIEDKATKKFIEMAAWMEARPIEQDKLIQLTEEVFGMKRNPIKKAINQFLAQRKKDHQKKNPRPKPEQSKTRYYLPSSKAYFTTDSHGNFIEISERTGQRQLFFLIDDN